MALGFSPLMRGAVLKFYLTIRGFQHGRKLKSPSGFSGCQKTSHRTASSIKFSDMCAEFGFSEALAQEKQFLRSGLRPENREVFSNPQASSCSTRIIRFSLKVSKRLFRHAKKPLGLLTFNKGKGGEIMTDFGIISVVVMIASLVLNAIKFGRDTNHKKKK